MILGAHVILTTYGFWLPNEERGSWSDFVRSWELFRFGPATKVDSLRSVARKPCDWNRRREMRESLSHKYVSFSGRQALAAALGFAEEIKHSGCRIYACSVLPEHVHLVMGRHEYDFEKLINRLNGSATRSLVKFWNASVCKPALSRWNAAHALDAQVVEGVFGFA